MAKGVEDAGTLALLGRLRCDIGQGNLFAAPVAAQELATPLEHVEVLTTR